MSSGKYSAVSGAIAKMHALETIANNVANVNTTGFKKDRPGFEAYLSAARQTDEARGMNFTRVAVEKTDLSQGANRTTGNPLDFAIDGPGFFKVRKNDVDYLTRQGDFKLDAKGSLLTADGSEVLSRDDSPIVLPRGEIVIDQQGAILANNEQVTQLGVFSVSDPNQLVKVADNMFKTPEGETPQTDESSRVMQGAVESSNVNMVLELALMTNNLRIFEAYQKTLKSYSEIGSKLDEIGSVG